MPRVVGIDPGTGSLDLLLLDADRVAGQHRFAPDELAREPGRFLAVLRSWAPLDLIAGPSGYGVPLIRGEDLAEADIDRMALVRADERGRDLGVLGFRGRVRELAASGLPVVFLPGGIHLPTIPSHRKANAIDHGTADKIAVAALALRMHQIARNTPLEKATFAVVEIGSAFTAILVIHDGQVVDTAAGTRGPIGLRSGGAWDGEVAYRDSPLSKADLFRRGLADLGDCGPAAFRESLRKHVAALRAVTPFDLLYLSGAGLDQPEIAALAHQALVDLGELAPLPSLPDAWVKHAAQGAALLADGLAGGPHADLVAALALRAATWDAADGRPGHVPH